MNIVLDPFDPASIKNALKQIEAYEKDLKEKEQEFVRRLAEIGVRVATTGFALADYDGVKDVVVTMNHNGSEAAIIASGKTVGFIEFGTGVRFREYKSDGLEYTPPAHGTYGKGRGKNPKGWFFGNSQHTYGNHPAEAMLTARDEIIDQIYRVAREVWK